jgi:hypothetical protein
VSQISTKQTRTRKGKQPAARKAPELREGSTMWAVVQVLRGKRKPMTAGEIYAEIRERKLAPGLYVERAEPGKFRLKR